MRKITALSKHIYVGFLLFISILNGQNYYDSTGQLIWNATKNNNYNYNITQIGRDDALSFNTKQSINISDISIGIKEIADTNHDNTGEFFANKTFLMWGHNNQPFSQSTTNLTKDLSYNISDISTLVSSSSINRIWKVIATGSVPTVKISIPKTYIPLTASKNEKFVMLISDNDSFTSNTSSVSMQTEGDNLEANFYFEGVKYITFGVASISSENLTALNFNGTDMYLDSGNINNLSSTSFTLSAWVKAEQSQFKRSIISKQNNFGHGYALSLDTNNKIQLELKNINSIKSSTLKSNLNLPNNKWHHIAVSYNKTNNTTNLFIDGVLDSSTTSIEPLISETDSHFMIGASNHINRENHFKGDIDEVRIWNVALSQKQILYMMNQEIIANADLNTTGKIIPSTITKNDASTLLWSNLISYYPMNRFVFGSTKDESIYKNDATMHNYSNIIKQTAPLPYKTQQNGSWDSPTTWLNGHVQNIPGAVSLSNNTKTLDNAIIEIGHNIIMNNSEIESNNRTVLGLIINNSTNLLIEGNTLNNSGNALTISHYLVLNGTIDLEGESQLIQTEGSDLEPSSSGNLERDQQGTSSTYIYNHWSSPVSQHNNSNYTTKQVISNVGFISSGYNGTSSPVKNADYWIWKYASNMQNTSCQWQHVRSSGSIIPGQGFTMKGPGTQGESQNYVFKGLPNNGDINLFLPTDNDYLIGNPYTSALDADEFIKDNLSIENGGNNTNGNIINGALYFWDHFALNSHLASEYQGSHGVYNLIGGVPPLNNDVRINNNYHNVYTPNRYIPIGKGFFVSSKSYSTYGIEQISGGTIVFNNKQRTFKKENTKILNDDRPKLKIIFNSPEGYHRQILLGADINASNNFDIGYDAPLIEDNKEDFYWILNDSKLLIQGVNEFNTTQKFPIGTKVNKKGIAKFKIESLENINDNLNIILHDKALNIFHNLSKNEYTFSIDSGVYTNRFELSFSSSQSLSIDSVSFHQENIKAYYSNKNKSFVIINPELKNIHHIEAFSIFGKKIASETKLKTAKYIEFKTSKIASGVYILKLQVQKNIISKKIFIH